MSIPEARRAATTSPRSATRAHVTWSRLAAAAVLASLGLGAPAPGTAVAAAGHAPLGTLDAVSVTATSITVRGWALDPDTPAPIAVHVYVGGAWRAQTRADAERPDVGAAYPTSGPTHGFRLQVPASAGPATVCVYAIDSTAGTNPLLGCRTVTVAGSSPVGNFERLTAIHGAVTLTGWALDVDGPRPGEVHYYVDGAWGGALTVGLERQDVARAFPDTGSTHGFSRSFTASPGAHRVCVFAIDTTTSPHTLLGCRTVTVPSAVLPIGNLEVVSAVGTSVTLRGWALDPDAPGPATVHYYVGGAWGGAVTTDQARPDVVRAHPGAGPAQGFQRTFTAGTGTHVVCGYAIDAQSIGSTPLGCRSVRVETPAPVPDPTPEPTPRPTLTSTPTATPGPTPAPTSPTASELLTPEHGLLFGAFAGKRGQEKSATAIADLEELMGRKLDLQRWFETWDGPITPSAVTSTIARGRTPILSVSARRSDGSPVPWGAIARGEQDATIRRHAAAVGGLGVPVFLVFQHEPDYSPGLGTPAEYRAAYRHYVEVFRAAGVTNVAWTWILTPAPFASPPTTPGGVSADDLYPGDDVVDWAGLDPYNWFGCAPGVPQRWRSIADAAGGFRAWGIAHGKPLMLAEWGSSEDLAQPGRKAAWYRETLATLEGWPEVKAISAFNTRGTCDWWVDSSPTSLQGFVDAGALSHSHGRASAWLRASTTKGTSPLTVSFDGSRSTGSVSVTASGVTSWTLELGDGTVRTGTGQPPAGLAHTYAVGTFEARLTVRDATGSTAVDRRTITSTRSS